MAPASPSVTPSISASPVGQSATPSASAPPVPSPASSGSASETVVQVDPALLDVIPSSVGGIALEYAPEASSETAADPQLAQSADAIAFAVGVDPATSDLVVASVIRPLPGVYDDLFFRGWRDSFNEGVCERAGGVSGNAQTEIDGRTVFVGTCSEGATVYHTYLGTRGVIVSVSSLGQRRLGEQLMGELRD
jgi:hypothetical protein